MIYDKLKIIIIYSLGGSVLLGLLWITLKFALPILLPFIAAYAIAYILSVGAKKLSNVTNMNENILKAVILLISIAAIALFLWFGASALFDKLSVSLNALSNEISHNGGLTETIKSLISKLGAWLGDEKITTTLTDLVSDATSKLSGFIANLATSFVSALPSFAIGCAVSIASLFYFTFGYEKATSAIKNLLPQKHRQKICSYIQHAMKGLGKFLRTYSIIIIVTFIELFVGFVVLRIDHAFALAAFISIVDFLPILGVGGVLLPWAIVSFVTGYVYRAIGLIILLAIIWAVRQPVEAKLIGRGAGVHPIFALAAVYTGFRLAGIFGMIAAPVLLTAGTVILKEKASP